MGSLADPGLQQARRFYSDRDWMLAAVIYKHAEQMAAKEDCELDPEDLERHRLASIRYEMGTQKPERVFELIEERFYPPVAWAICPFCTAEFYTRYGSRDVECPVCEGIATQAQEATECMDALLQKLPELPRTEETLETVYDWYRKLGELYYRNELHTFCEGLEEELGLE